jgi:hypothetical protein
MNILKYIKREEGYTLLETVVAMALFVAVLIPLGTIIGNLMLDKTSERLNRALNLAQTEISYSIANKDYTDRTISTDGKLLVERKVKREFNLVEITVKVITRQNPEKSLIVLNKNIVVYQ